MSDKDPKIIVPACSRCGRFPPIECFDGMNSALCSGCYIDWLKEKLAKAEKENFDLKIEFHDKKEELYIYEYQSEEMKKRLALAEEMAVDLSEICEKAFNPHTPKSLKNWREAKS